MGFEANIPYIVVGVIVAIFLASGIKVIRPTHRAAIETLGKYTGFRDSGLTYVFPVVQKLYSLNITEQLVDVQQQDVITEDNLNCKVDAQVYYKIGDRETELKNALYNVHNVNRQMVQLARTTLRDVIGQKKFKDVNNKRSELNDMIFNAIEKETHNWGVKVVRVELKEIEPPPEVQKTMNAIIQADNEKVAAKDMAEAVKTRAEGDKWATLQRAEGEKEAQILIAEGEAEAIQRIANANAEKYRVESASLTEHFKDTAITYKQLETAENAYKVNSKIIVADPKNPLNLIIGDDDRKVIPVPNNDTRYQKGRSSSNE